MRVFYNNGIHVQEGIKEIVLDPVRPTEASVVSHAHMDHLVRGAIMTPQTRDVMKIRIKDSEGICLEYRKERKVSGFVIALKEAGHVFGSAMVRIGPVLYTGDFNPEGGPTCNKALPEDCDVLIMEATYGKPMFSFPPKEEVMNDLLSWTETSLETGPVAIGAYEFGKAQELISLMNSIGADVVVSDRIAEIAEVYRRHGLSLRYRRYRELEKDEKRSPHVLIVPRRMLKKPTSAEISELRSNSGKTSFVSGWCSIFNFGRSYDLDAQFPLSDHGDFEDLLWFVEACNPKKVYTCHGYSEELAKEVQMKLGIPSEPVGLGWF